MKFTAQTRNNRYNIMSYENLSVDSSDIRMVTFITSRKKGRLVSARAFFEDSNSEKITFFRYRNGTFLQENCSFELKNNYLVSILGALQAQEEIYPESLDVFSYYLKNHCDNPAYQMALGEVQMMYREKTAESKRKTNSRN